MWPVCSVTYLPGLYRPVRISRLRIANGYQREDPRYADLFQMNNRVRKLQICANGTECEAVELEDTRGLQSVDFEQDEVHVLRLKILDVYPGTKWNDTAIGEAQVLGELHSSKSQVEWIYVASAVILAVVATVLFVRPDLRQRSFAVASAGSARIADVAANTLRGIAARTERRKTEIAARDANLPKNPSSGNPGLGRRLTAAIAIAVAVFASVTFLFLTIVENLETIQLRTLSANEDFAARLWLAQEFSSAQGAVHFETRCRGYVAALDATQVRDPLLHSARERFGELCSGILEFRRTATDLESRSLLDVLRFVFFGGADLDPYLVAFQQAQALQKTGLEFTAELQEIRSRYASSIERVEGLSPEDQRLYFETGRVPFRWPRLL